MIQLKLLFIIQLPSRFEAVPWAYATGLNRITIFAQSPYLFAACLARGNLCCSLNVFIPEEINSQRLRMVKYTTGTATEIQSQQDSNPVLSTAIPFLPTGNYQIILSLATT